MFDNLKQITQQLREAHSKGNTKLVMSLISRYEERFRYTARDYNQQLTLAEKGSKKTRHAKIGKIKDDFNAAKLEKGELGRIRRSTLAVIQQKAEYQEKLQTEFLRRQQAWEHAINQLEMIQGHQAAAEDILKSNCRDYLGLVSKYELIHKAMYRAAAALPTFDTDTEAFKKSKIKDISEVARKVNAAMRRFKIEYEAIVETAVKVADQNTSGDLIDNVIASVGLLLGSDLQKPLREAMAKLTHEELLALTAPSKDIASQEPCLFIQDAEISDQLVPFVGDSALVAQEESPLPVTLVSLRDQVSTLQKIAQKTGDKALVVALKQVEQQLAKVASGEATQLSLLSKTNDEIKVVHINLEQLAQGNLNDIVNIIRFMRPTPETELHVRFTTPVEAARLSLVDGYNLSALIGQEMQQLGYITEAVSSGALVPSGLGALVSGNKTVLESSPEFLSLVEQFSNGGLTSVRKDGLLTQADITKVVRAMTVALTAGGIAAQATSLEQAQRLVGLLSGQKLMIKDVMETTVLPTTLALMDVSGVEDVSSDPTLLPIVDELMAELASDTTDLTKNKSSVRVSPSEDELQHQYSLPIKSGLTDIVDSVNSPELGHSPKPDINSVGGSNLALQVLTEVLKGLATVALVAGAIAAVSALIVSTGGFGLAPVVTFGAAIVAKAGILTSAMGLGASTATVGTVGGVTAAVAGGGLGLYGLFSSKSEKQPSVSEQHDTLNPVF